MDKYDISDIWNCINSLNDFPLTTTKPVKDVLVDGKSVVNKANVAILGDKSKTVSKVKKIDDFLYEAEYDDIDYDGALRMFEKYMPERPAFCSAVRNGNFLGRNFDWLYNYNVDFVIKINASKDRYASLNVSYSVNGLDKDTVQSGKYTESYRYLPFFTVDGINEHGLVAEINVVPKGGAGFNDYTVPEIEKKYEICSLMVPRFVLDHYKTAYEAVEGLKNYVSVFNAETALLEHYEEHFLIADPNETYIVEMVDNMIKYFKVGEGESHPAIMTNFHINDTVIVDGKIDDTPENKSHVELLGAGLERYNIAIDGYSDCGTLEGMTDMMTNKLKYTNAYKPDSDPIWYTEMVGARNLTVESPRADFEPVLEIAREMFANREENRKKGVFDTWQSTHSSIYDIEKKELHIYVQEDGIEHVFNLDTYITLS